MKILVLIPTLLLPFMILMASVFTWPLVLQNSTVHRFMIAVLIASPLASIGGALKLSARRYYLVLLAIFVAQVLIEAYLNRWWRLI